MAALNPFNPDDVEDDFAICPDGEGVAQAISSSIKAIDGVGLILNVEYQFLDGPLEGKHAFEGLFLEHTNPQVVEIAQRSLKRLCGAVGHAGVLSDSDALHFKPFRLKVGHRKDKKDIDRNTFAYSAIGGAVGAAPTTTAGAPASTPWGKKAA